MGIENEGVKGSTRHLVLKFDIWQISYINFLIRILVIKLMLQTVFDIKTGCLREKKRLERDERY